MTSEKQRQTPVKKGSKENEESSISEEKYDCKNGETNSYWKLRYEKLEDDYSRLQKLNQNLEGKLLTIVETCENEKKDIIERIEFEKSTLMADVDKLSNKLVDARIKLHDFEEREMIRQAELSQNQVIESRGKASNGTKANHSVNNDPNLI